MWVVEHVSWSAVTINIGGQINAGDPGKLPQHSDAMCASCVFEKVSDLRVTNNFKKSFIVHDTRCSVVRSYATVPLSEHLNEGSRCPEEHRKME